MSTVVSDPGETSLSILLSTLTTTLHPATYVFATLRDDAKLPPMSEMQLLFRESEGYTVIITQEYATAQGMQHFFPCKMITLNVTSSLEAVGFMAVVGSRLAARGLGANPVSGYYHDHLFVPLGKEDDAVAVLEALSSEMRIEIAAQISK